MLPKEKTSEAQIIGNITERKEAIRVLEDLIKQITLSMKTCKDNLNICTAADNALIEEIEELKRRLRRCEEQQSDQKLQQRENIIDIHASMASQHVQTISDVNSAYCKRPQQPTADPASSYTPYPVQTTSPPTATTTPSPQIQSPPSPSPPPQIQSKPPPTVSTDGRCGNEFNTKCPPEQCCSTFGFCGTGNDHCVTQRDRTPDDLYQGDSWWKGMPQ